MKTVTVTVQLEPDEDGDYRAYVSVPNGPSETPYAFGETPFDAIREAADLARGLMPEEAK